jgi:hypothetical protein
MSAEAGNQTQQRLGDHHAQDEQAAIQHRRFGFARLGDVRQ